jgi:hypothetical protein
MRRFGDQGILLRGSLKDVVTTRTQIRGWIMFQFICFLGTAPNVASITLLSWRPRIGLKLAFTSRDFTFSHSLSHGRGTRNTSRGKFNQFIHIVCSTPFLKLVQNLLLGDYLMCQDFNSSFSFWFLHHLTVRLHPCLGEMFGKIINCQSCGV